VHQKINSLFKYYPNPLIVIDDDRNIVYSNKKFLRLANIEKITGLSVKPFLDIYISTIYLCNAKK
jgi:hypothetical protein